MTVENELRQLAREDLARFITTQYLMREQSPIADREVTEPLLKAPVAHRLTRRELVAAQALADLATYEIRSRAVFEIANPAMEIGSTTPPPGMNADQERELNARYEVFRRSALAYGQLLDDIRLIGHYQTPVPPSAAAPNATQGSGKPDDAHGGTGATMTEPERRLARLRSELGGDARYKNCTWSFHGSTKLALIEKSEGRARSSEKTIRADLKEAAQAERDAKAAGFGAGLGQR
jgi:hypothetical protein